MKKFLITVFIVLLAAAAAVGWYVFFYQAGGGANQAATSPESDRRTFFPLGLFGGEAETDTDADEGGTTTNAGGVFVPPVRQVVPDPVAAAVFTDRNGKLVLRYIDRATGHIFDAYATSTVIVPVSNTTVPRIQNAVWIDPLRLFVQYLEEDTNVVETFVGNVHEPAGTSTEGLLTGDFLPPNLLAVAANPEGGVFSLTGTPDGSLGNITLLDGTVRLVFTSPLREWLPQWGGSEVIGMTTKPSGNVPGYFFLLSLESGSFSKVLAGLRGLTTNINQDGTAVIYASADDGMFLKRTILDSGVTQHFSVRTVPEKCVWGTSLSSVVYCGVPDALPVDMPDSWYRGTTSLSDSLWQIDTETGLAVLIADLFDFGEAIDMVSPSVSDDGSSLSFVNKRDGSLWLVQLEPVAGED